MLCVPAARLLVLNVATPEEFSVTGGPRAVVPSSNVTVPVGIAVMPLTGEATVEVNVIEVPASAGLAEEVRVVLLPPSLKSTAAPEKSNEFPLTTTSVAPSPYISASARPQAQRSAGNSTGA